MNPRQKDKINKRLTKNGGFSLIEILIVTVITTLVFTVIYAFYSASIKHNVESRYEIVASNLAQEGIEIIRNIRDESVMAGDDINGNLSDSPCYPEIATDGTTSCTASSGGGTEEVKVLGDWYLNSPTGTATSFERSCEITDDGDPTEMLMAICTVSWESFLNSGLTRKVEAKAVLTNWQ